jgi:hypothetical protein
LVLGSNPSGPTQEGAGTGVFCSKEADDSRKVGNVEGNASDAQSAREAAAKYPNVKNAHIVPRTYLENFADDGKIGVVLVPEQRKLVQAVSNVGTRRRFYRRERPKDGTPIDDIEWSLAPGEDAATQILRSFAEKWPLSLRTKENSASSSRSR